MRRMYHFDNENKIKISSFQKKKKMGNEVDFRLRESRPSDKGG